MQVPNPVPNLVPNPVPIAERRLDAVRANQHEDIEVLRPAPAQLARTRRRQRGRSARARVAPFTAIAVLRMQRRQPPRHRNSPARTHGRCSNEPLRLTFPNSPRTPAPSGDSVQRGLSGAHRHPLVWQGLAGAPDNRFSF